MKTELRRDQAGIACLGPHVSLGRCASIREQEYRTLSSSPKGQRPRRACPHATTPTRARADTLETPLCMQQNR
jgi:hypothetical protein